MKTKVNTVLREYLVVQEVMIQTIWILIMIV